MLTFEDVAGIAEALPNVKIGERWGNRTWLTNARGFAWERPFSKADIKRFGTEPAPTGSIVAVATADLSDKEGVLANGDRGVFTIEHFNGYPAVLIQLSTVDKVVLRELIVDAWLACANADEADQFARAHQPDRTR